MNAPPQPDFRLSPSCLPRDRFLPQFRQIRTIWLPLTKDVDYADRSQETTRPLSKCPSSFSATWYPIGEGVSVTCSAPTTEARGPFHSRHHYYHHCTTTPPHSAIRVSASGPHCELLNKPIRSLLASTLLQLLCLRGRCIVCDRSHSPVQIARLDPPDHTALSLR